MDTQKVVYGKKGGYLDMVVVRVYRYKKRAAQVIMDKVTEMWRYLDIPPNTKVVNVCAPTKWGYNNNPLSNFASSCRFACALIEFSYNPAQWFVIVDADVIPTRRSALTELHDFLMCNPQCANADIATRHIITDWFILCDKLRARRVSCSGINTNAISEGIVAMRYKLMRLLSNWSVFLLSNNYFTEMEYSMLLPQLRFVEFPLHICEVVNIYEVRWVTDLSPAFLHPSGGDYSAPHIAQLSRVISSAWERLKEG